MRSSESPHLSPRPQSALTNPNAVLSRTLPTPLFSRPLPVDSDRYEAFDLSHCVLSTRKSRLPTPWGPPHLFLIITRGAPFLRGFLSHRRTVLVIHLFELAFSRKWPGYRTILVNLNVKVRPYALNALIICDLRYKCVARTMKLPLIYCSSPCRCQVSTRNPGRLAFG